MCFEANDELDLGSRARVVYGISDRFSKIVAVLLHLGERPQLRKRFLHHGEFVAAQVVSKRCAVGLSDGTIR